MRERHTSAPSERLSYTKYVYDSIHGNIGITQPELDLIDTPVFQRLHRIKQLGIADLVFPGATHSRFAHSLGAMFVMNRYLDNVTQAGKPIASNAEEKQKLRLAALLHDVGHYPFSHSLETPITDEFGGYDHEKHGAHIVRSVLKDHMGTYTPNEILAILQKRVPNNVFSQLISSEFDIDKLDYLMRDSYHTGVAYGYVDADRLLRTLTFDAEGNIVFEKPGPVIEDFLFGRYHMFQAVYYHKTVIAFNLLIERIYSLLVNAGEIMHPNDFLKSEDEWLLTAFDDDYIWQCMRQYRSKNKSDYLSALIEMVLRRKPLAMAVQVALPAEKGTVPVGYSNIASIKRMDAVMNRFAEATGISKDWIFPFLAPKPISLLPDDTPVFVKRRNTVIRIQDDPALIFKRLGGTPIYDARIYCKTDCEGSVRNTYESFKPY